MASRDDELIEVGRVLGVHGVKGQIRVFSHTDPRENIVRYSPWVVERRGQRRQMKVSGSRVGKHVVARLEGIDDRDQAEDWIGATIYIRRDQLPRLPGGEYYWSQLVGLQVENLQGEAFGEVDHLIETGANDVLVVKGERERLIPWLPDDVIREVDLQQGRIRVDWDADF